MRLQHNLNQLYVGRVVKPVIRRKIAWQSCSVQTMGETTIPPIKVDKSLKKIAQIANEMTTQKSVVQ